MALMAVVNAAVMLSPGSVMWCSDGNSYKSMVCDMYMDGRLKMLFDMEFCYINVHILILQVELI